MKILLGIVVLGLLWCSFSTASEMNVRKKIKLPKDVASGYENPWGLSCTWTEDGKCMTPKYALQVVNKKDKHPVRLGKKSITD